MEKPPRNWQIKDSYNEDPSKEMGDLLLSDNAIELYRETYLVILEEQRKVSSNY